MIIEISWEPARWILFLSGLTEILSPGKGYSSPDFSELCTQKTWSQGDLS